MRVLPALVTAYLALSLALGVAQQSYLWFRGQHATPQQWSAHERFEQRGHSAHHSHSPNRPGQIPPANLFETDASAAPTSAALMPPDGTSCALSVPALGEPPLCPTTTLDGLRSLAPPGPPLAPPLLPPRAR